MTEESWWTPWRELEGVTVLHVDLTPSADREARAIASLDDNERVRLNAILCVKARRRFALCRSALRVVLSERFNCRNRQLSFDSLEHGKPVALVSGQLTGTEFNVSHSGRHGLIAIAAHACVGIDVEERVAKHDFGGIGSLVYGPGELQLLESSAGTDRVHLFYRVWSMKEALIKALGTGFSLSPAGFEIPEEMLLGAQTGCFRFPHLPEQAWRLLDLGEPRFAAALAYRLPS